MTAKRKFEGKTLQDALHAAAEALGIPEPELDYRILDPGRRGLFGIGAKATSIEIHPPLDENGEEAKSFGRRPARRAATAPKASSAPDTVAATGESTDPREGRRSRRSRRGSRRKGGGQEGRPQTGTPEVAAAAPDGTTTDTAGAEKDGEAAPRSRRSRSRSRRRGKGTPRNDLSTDARAESSPARRPARPPVNPTPVPEDQALRAKEMLGEMLERMGFEVEVSGGEPTDPLQLTVAGPDLPALTRKDGEVLSALQFLLNRMSRRAWPDVTRVQVGADGQPQEDEGASTGRDDELVELTREVVQQVSRTGKTKRLHPMNAYERRIVHLTVRQSKTAGSRSEGEGAVKTVRIFKLRKKS